MSEAYHHTWDWEGRSNRFTRSSSLPSNVETDIVETAKERAESTILGELASQCLDQGIVITLRSCDIHAEVVLEKRERRWRGRHELYYLHYYHVDVKAKTLFDTDKPLTESPIAVAMVIAIGKVISMIILAVLVGWGVFTFLDNMSTRKSEIKTVTEWYDPETGELVKREEKSEKIEEPPLGGLGFIVGIIAVVGLLLLFLVGLPRRR